MTIEKSFIYTASLQIEIRLSSLKSQSTSLGGLYIALLNATVNKLDHRWLLDTQAAEVPV